MSREPLFTLRRDRETGRLFYVDPRTGEEVDPDRVSRAQEPARGQASGAAPAAQWTPPAVSQDVRLWAELCTNHPRLQPEMDRLPVEKQAPAKACILAEVRRQTALIHSDISVLRQAAAAGDEAAAGILAVREEALEEAAFHAEWTPTALRMAQKAGYSEETLRADFHKQRAAANGATPREGGVFSARARDGLLRSGLSGAQIDEAEDAAADSAAQSRQ